MVMEKIKTEPERPGRIVTTEMFKRSMEELTAKGYNFNSQAWRFMIPNAKDLIQRGMRYLMKREPRWLPEYNEIVEWMQDNKGKGLLVEGNCGLGKTLICGKVIPILLNCLERKNVTAYTAQELNEKIDEAKTKAIVYIDDIGTEQELVSYGNRRNAFCELVDYAEGRNNIIIVTTNLTTEQISEKYGVRTVDRLRGITKVVVMSGDSLRDPRNR